MAKPLITNYSELLDSLNLSRKTVAEHGRFISTLCRLSMEKKSLTNSQVIKTIKQFTGNQNSDVQKYAKQTLQQWKRVQSWQKRYTKNPKALFIKVLKQNPVFPFNINYTPLGIILTIDEADYFSTLEDSSSNATTIFDFAVPIIVLHEGGYICKPINANQFRRTLRHELHHTIFDSYYNVSDKRLPNIEAAIKVCGQDLQYHKVYADDLALFISESSRTEFFAFISNQQTDFWLTGINHEGWLRRLARINYSLLELPKCTTQQRRTIYDIYLQHYYTYLKNLSLYERLILSLPVNNVIPILALTPFNNLKSIKLINQSTDLQKQIRRVRRNRDVKFTTKLTLHRSKRFTETHDQPNPQQLLRFVKTLSKYNPEEWTFLRKYIIKKSLVNPDGLALMKYIIEFCPDDSACSTVCLVLRIIVEDNTLTRRQYTSLKIFLERMLTVLPEHRPAYLTISNLLNDVQAIS